VTFRIAANTPVVGGIAAQSVVPLASAEQSPKLVVRAEAATPSSFLPSVVSLLQGDRMARNISNVLDFLLHLPNQFLDAGISL